MFSLHCTDHAFYQALNPRDESKLILGDLAETYLFNSHRDVQSVRYRHGLSLSEQDLFLKREWLGF